MPDQKNPADGVTSAPGASFNDVTEKYDADHGKYADNVPNTGTLTGQPNASPAAPDPSPFKMGPT